MGKFLKDVFDVSTDFMTVITAKTKFAHFEQCKDRIGENNKGQKSDQEGTLVPAD